MSVDIGPVPSTAAQSASVARSAPEEADVENDAPVMPVAPGAPAEEAPQTESRVNSMLERLIDAGTKVDSRLSIDQDDITGSYVYRILDGRTGEVVRQFPYEEQLELLRYLNEQQGLVVDQKA